MRNKKIREKRKFWQPMIDHIDRTWRKRKNMDFGYPFTGKDTADLRHFTSIFQEWGLMALWDEYLDENSEFNKKQGWSIFQFTRQLPRLVDKMGWKDKAKKYEAELVGKYPREELADLFTVVDNLVHKLRGDKKTVAEGK